MVLLQNYQEKNKLFQKLRISKGLLVQKKNNLFKACYKYDDDSKISNLFKKTSKTGIRNIRFRNMQKHGKNKLSYKLLGFAKIL